MDVSAAQAEARSHEPWKVVPRWLRLTISLWLLYHVIAICVPPLVVPPSSGLTWTVSRVFRPYLQALYLNHGFHYFAPQPSENSTLVAFTVKQSNGATIKGIMPHRRIWPRQLYHRHFMLTESLSYIPDELQPEWYQSYADCLARQYRGHTVQLTLVKHYLPSPQMVLEGVPLENPDSFVETPLGEFECNADGSRGVSRSAGGPAQ